MRWNDSLVRILASRPVQVLCRLVLGGIFIYASLDKITHPRVFAGIIANYGILPEWLVTLPALVLPWLELIAGLCLVAGFWVRSSALLLSLLLLAFILALGFNALRGFDMSCGCFSTSASDKESALILILRDLLILLPGLVIVFFGREKPIKRFPFSFRGRG
ncbi:MAG: DoxX family membrane protein [Candidatus Aminicenantes bacterium]|nr:DoxX family membrane protein [Candidatus Aminicenantes bacterium]